MPLLIALLVGGALFLLLAPGRPSPQEAAWADWPGSPGRPAAADKAARPAGPLARWLAGVLSETQVGRNLVVAGSPCTLEELAARKLRLAGLSLAAALLLWLLGRAGLAAAALVAAAWGFFGPDLEVARKAAARRTAVRKDLPMFLFTLAVLTEAGLHLLPALDHYCRQSRSPLAGELRTALAEIRLGQSPALAFLNLAQELDVRDFTLFVAALVQSMEKGTDGLAEVLRSQAAAAWDKRRRRAQELGAKASVRLFIPLLLFVLPAVLALAAGPALYQFLTQFMP